MASVRRGGWAGSNPPGEKLLDEGGGEVRGLGGAARFVAQQDGDVVGKNIRPAFALKPLRHRFVAHQDIHEIDKAPESAPACAKAKRRQNPLIL